MIVKRAGLISVYKRIIVGFDGSEASYKALLKAADLAKSMGAELHVLSVVPPPSVMLGELMTPQIIDPKPLAEAAEKTLATIKKRLEEEKAITPETKVIIGDPAETIVDYARDIEADLIVVGRRGLSRLERLFIGSVTKKVLERADRDVLVVIG